MENFMSKYQAIYKGAQIAIMVVGAIAIAAVSLKKD